MPAFIAGLRPFNVTMATRLYDRANELLVPSFSGRRMRLPCMQTQCLPNQAPFLVCVVWSQDQESCHWSGPGATQVIYNRALVSSVTSLPSTPTCSNIRSLPAGITVEPARSIYFLYSLFVHSDGSLCVRFPIPPGWLGDWRPVSTFSAIPQLFTHCTQFTLFPR